jgi:hypothetical protein
MRRIAGTFQDGLESFRRADGSRRANDLGAEPCFSAHASGLLEGAGVAGFDSALLDAFESVAGLDSLEDELEVELMLLELSDEEEDGALVR